MGFLLKLSSTLKFVHCIRSDDPADLFMTAFSNELKANQDANQLFVSASMY